MKDKLSVPGIYIWENLSTCKVYVGLSSNIYLRRNVHIARLRRGIHWNKYLQAAWNKYGERYFRFRILEIVEKNKLVEREQYWIDFYKSYDNKYGYNLNPIANRTTGYHHTDEAKRKISEANFKKDYAWVTEEQKDRLRKLRIGTKLTKAHKQAISESNKGRFVGYVHSEQSRKNMSAAHKGKYPSEETKRKRSITMKKIWEDRRK